MSLKDAAGHEQESSCFTLVRGEDDDGAKELRFDDLELLTAKTEYLPGDEVEVMVNTNRPGSTVAALRAGRERLLSGPGMAAHGWQERGASLHGRSPATGRISGSRLSR